MKVYVIVSYYKSSPFFCRLAEADKDKSYIFVCVSVAAYFYIKRRGLECVFFNPFYSSSNKIHKESDLMNAIEYRALFASKDRCLSYCDRFYYFLDSFISKEQDKDIYLITWNGDNLNGIVMRGLANKYINIKTGFFEISNLPGKIFVDGKGVNKSSSLYINPEFLDDLPQKILPETVISYRRSYLDFKKKYKVKKEKTISWYLKYCDAFLFSFFQVRSFKVSNFLKRDVVDDSLITSFVPDEFCLYPLQVRTDTQLILNSDCSIRDGLLKIIDDTELPILITPHPYDRGAINDIVDIVNSNERVYISSKGTFDLIDKARKIYVINSTLGLEARLIGKPVNFLGNSFFSKLSDKQVDKYVHSFLIDGDFLGGGKLNENVVESIYRNIDETFNRFYFDG